VLTSRFGLMIWCRVSPHFSYHIAEVAQKGHKIIAAKIWVLDQLASIEVPCSKSLVTSHTIAITGSARVGKSSFALELSKAIGLPVVILDSLLDFVRQKKLGDDGAAIVQTDYQLAHTAIEILLENLNFPVILEGAILIDNAIPIEYDYASHNYSLHWLKKLSVSKCVQVFIVIPLSLNPEQKSRDILAYRLDNRCWTSDRSDIDVRILADLIILRSAELEKLAIQLNFKVLKVDSEAFSDSVQMLVDKVVKSL
jgi:hypothetical protein